jgi:hypothetical protein
MQITGKITRVLPPKSGTTKKGGTWTAQQYVLVTGDADNSTILLNVFGQKEIDEYAITEGETLTVTFVPKISEYGDRVFGRNTVTGIERPQCDGLME